MSGRARAILPWVAAVLLLVLLLFLPAGRLDWAEGWLCVGLMVAGFAGLYVYVAPRSPGLAGRRARVGAGTPKWDLVLVGILRLCLVAALVVAGLDAGRYGWAVLPAWTILPGLVLYLAGLVVMAWAMGSNPFFESTVRIQREEGHRVVATGPYRLVRHPGYVAFILLFGGLPLVLRSGWMYVPVGLAAVLLVVRAWLEDRFLRSNLPGYAEYAGRVRYRLLPGVW